MFRFFQTMIACVPFVAVASSWLQPEPLSHYGNKATYSVNGQSYHVMKGIQSFQQFGNASWYGHPFHGRKTSSMEIYDMNLLTAAHRTLPIPCYVKVTRLDNQKSVVVRVNDRGPFHSERIIDLSYAAAQKLDLVDVGVARVRLNLLIAPKSA